MGTSKVVPTRRNFSSGESTPISWNTVRLVWRVARVFLRAWRKLAITGDRHDPNVIGSERVHNIEHVLRGRVCQRLGSAALSLDRVPRRLGIDQFEPTLFAHRKAGHRIVSAVCGKQKLAIW